MKNKEYPNGWLHLIGCSHCLADNFPPGVFDFSVEQEVGVRVTHEAIFSQFIGVCPQFNLKEYLILATDKRRPFSTDHH